MIPPDRSDFIKPAWRVSHGQPAPGSSTNPVEQPDGFDSSTGGIENGERRCDDKRVRSRVGPSTNKNTNTRIMNPYIRVIVEILFLDGLADCPPRIHE